MDRRAKETAASLRMGEMNVGRDGEQLRTLLGSCIGLALYDRKQKIGGLAHILLPLAPEVTDRPGKFVDTAVPKLIQEMNQLATAQLRLTAKIAGGASMFSNSIAANIGTKNTEACQQLLNKMGIPIVAESCGGNQGRRMTLDTTDGNVFIDIVGEATIRL